MTTEPEPVTRGRFTFVFSTFFLTIILLLVIEGAASFVVSVLDSFSRTPPLEKLHTRYDEEIGWVNLPNLSIEEMYGPGKFYRTNSMGFRNDEEFDFSIPAGKTRVVCSGDSFTMGYRVSNDEAWCKLLESIDSRIESVNLGLGAYGIDQSYLLYKRNMGKLEHNIHIFAFIADDFERMQSAEFEGSWGKPFLALENGVLVNKNDPVHQPLSDRFPPMLRRAAKNLGIVKLVKDSIAPKEDPTLDSLVKTVRQTREVAARIFEDLHNSSKAANNSLVLVLLPTQGDFIGGESEPWRQFVRSEAEKKGILYVDLFDEFRQTDVQEVKTMFFEGDGHYTESGNAFFASLLYKKLLAFPEIQAKLNKK